MTEETKRNVFEGLLGEFADACIELDGEGIGDSLTVEEARAYLQDYDAALPDDLPRIPKSIDSIIHQSKATGWNLYKLMSEVTDRQQFAADRGGHDKGADWIAEHADDFARAWVLGAWRVEETGKVVRA